MGEKITGALRTLQYFSESKRNLWNALLQETGRKILQYYKGTDFWHREKESKYKHGASYRLLFGCLFVCLYFFLNLILINRRNDLQYQRVLSLMCVFF